MLDSLLGNVFGRSKKDKNQSNNQNNGPNGETSEGFVVVGQQVNPTDVSADQNSLYPRVATMLTQEMIVGQTSGGAQSFVERTNIVHSYSSPIDNIPFSPPFGNEQHLVDDHMMSLSNCMKTIERIQQYLTTESQSEYNFHLENTILSESLLT